ncbi:MAG: hypothetical protein N2043_02330 [Ignavibacterium sp.]|nr:hypothetical protein [Ignavibacterium sp.]
MPFVKIRGAQIQDQTILNRHIADNAQIHESKLDIDWEGHYHEALSKKKVVDYVQVSNQQIEAGFSILDVTSILSGNNPTTSDPLDAEGVIINAPKNKIIVRDFVTGDPIVTLDGNGKAKEVFGRLVYTPEENNGGNIIPEKWEVHFFYKDENNQEVPYSFAETTTIDFQYAKRFNLDVVGEMFAANEKFVEGAADATAHLNIQQIAKDLYANFQLNRDGNPTLQKPIQTQLLEEIDRAQQEEQRLENLIITEQTERQQAITQLIQDLASTVSGKGASLIGVEANANYTGTTLQQVLNDIASRLTYQEQNGGAEVEATRSRDNDTQNGYFVANQYNTLEERINSIEEVADREFAEHDAIKAEVETARSSFNNLNERLVSVDNKNTEQDNRLTEIENYVSAESVKFHVHKKHVYIATGGETSIQLPNGEYFQIGEDTLDVYVNGALQAKGLNYVEVADSQNPSIGVGVDFGTSQLAVGDVIVLKYINNNPQKTF